MKRENTNPLPSQSCQPLAAMQFDVSIISTDSYAPEEIVGEEIPDKYLYNDQGDFVFASAILNSENTVKQLTAFLFPKSQPVNEVYRDDNAYILDLSSIRDNLIDFDYLEKHYANWLENTGRENTMNEYGMLSDFIGFAHKGKDKKHLLIVIASRLRRS
jgi:hypothetical protein